MMPVAIARKLRARTARRTCCQRQSSAGTGRPTSWRGSRGFLLAIAPRSFRALHHAQYGRMFRVIEVLEQELERGRNGEPP
jgi:hypothetical protein